MTGRSSLTAATCARCGIWGGAALPRDHHLRKAVECLTQPAVAVPSAENQDCNIESTSSVSEHLVRFATLVPTRWLGLSDRVRLRLRKANTDEWQQLDHRVKYVTSNVTPGAARREHINSGPESSPSVGDRPPMRILQLQPADPGEERDPAAPPTRRPGERTEARTRPRPRCRR